MPEVRPANPDEEKALPPELLRSVSALARALVAAARCSALYPPEHPAVKTSVDRLRTALHEASAGQAFAFGVTPDTLIVDGIAASARETPVAEAAGWLHQRDILQLTFGGDVPAEALQMLLGVLADDVASIRARGGPARAWAEAGHPSIAVEQVDLSRVLEDREVQHPARTKDDLWKAIVTAVLDRRKALDEAVQRRLLDIAGDSVAIGQLAQDVIAPNHAADGSPMLTTQAAAVVAAYRHLVSIVDVMAPDRRAEVMQNLATATASLDPRIVMQMLSGAEEGAAPGGSPGIKRGLAEAFDDMKVAQLLATTLAIDGQASERLAEVFDTIAPDEPRKRRVLTLTRSLLSETSFGRGDQFQSLWSSMEALLLTYNERPFVSADYKAGLDHAGGRAAQMAASDVPADLLALVDSLGQDNVRRLSVILLIDLLTLERDQARATEIAGDVAALCEDLLLAGDYESAVDVTRVLAEQAADSAAIAGGGSRLALDGLVSTIAFREAVDMLGEMSDAEAALVARVCANVGPAATDALRNLLDVEALTPARRRATAIIREFGGRASRRLAAIVSSPHWYTQRNVAELMGEVRSADAVPLLQPLLRGTDPRVMRAAVRALSAIDDPAAARSVHTVLRAAAGEQRHAVVAALVAERDPRVVPVLVRILNESDALGADHVIVLETLGALGDVGDDQAVPSLSAAMGTRRWVGRRKLRAVKSGALEALRRIGTPAAQRAVSDAAAHGDRMLRKLARTMTAPAVSHG
jgi:HEAT repeat protein